MLLLEGAKDAAELEDFEAFLNFYRQYLANDIGLVGEVGGNRVPMRRNYLMDVRAHRIDKFCEEIRLPPQQFIQNLHAQRLLH